MSSRSCPDWPDLMELAPELQFKHYTLREAQTRCPPMPSSCSPSSASDEDAICCDLESHVFNAEHTDPHVAEALRASHWFDLREWAARSSGGSDG